MAEIVNCLGDILRIHAELSPDRVVVGSLSHEAEQTTVTDLDPHEARIDGVIDVLESELRGCSGVTGNHDCRVADCDAVTHPQARGAWIRWPLTKVPLVEPRSAVILLAIRC